MTDGWNTIAGLVGVVRIMVDKGGVLGYTMYMLNDFGVAK
jgi:hypothetical protein